MDKKKLDELLDGLVFDETSDYNQLLDDWDNRFYNSWKSSRQHRDDEKRGIEKNVEKTEKELCSIFDSVETDCMEVDMGLLVRRKQEKGYEWLIEI